MPKIVDLFHQILKYIILLFIINSIIILYKIYKYIKLNSIITNFKVQNNNLNLIKLSIIKIYIYKEGKFNNTRIYTNIIINNINKYICKNKNNKQNNIQIIIPKTKFNLLNNLVKNYKYWRFQIPMDLIK
jgi:hypothetical protein